MKQLFISFVIILSFYSNILIAQQFGIRVDKGTIESSEIREASGIAESRKNPGVLWTHNDSGDKSKIFAFDSLGTHLGSFLLAGVQNRDWEDIAIGPGNVEGVQYIYIGDIGDNSIRYNEKYIYRIEEPTVNIGQTPKDTVIYKVDRLVFQYPDGNRNAETLMIDPITLDIYVVSKEQNTKVYKATYPYTFYSSPTFNVDTLEEVTSLPFSTAVGGDISSDGKEILIKKTNIIYYWEREDGQTIEDVLKATPTVVPYIKEPQGEAVCWSADLSGYYTISEGSHPHLYYYPRMVTSISNQENKLFEFKLNQNYPNPFNPSTTIKYSIPSLRIPLSRGVRGVVVTLKVYDILGREIVTLVNKEQKPGNYEIQFDAKKKSNGLYFYTLKTNGFTQTKKMLLLR